MLSIPLISRNTAARTEGYFRLEWSLAEARSHMIARNKAFIVPVCLDQTTESGADVPESFQRVRWTRLPDGNTPPAFTARIAALLGAPVEASDSTAASVTQPNRVRAAPARPTWGARLATIALATLVVVGLGYFVFERFKLSKQTAANRPAVAVAPAPSVPAIPEKSVAVLPFVDISENHDQGYFADGMAEELIDLLAKTQGLHVIARTSSFSFKGKSDDISTIASKLRVSHLLEGSVRKAGGRLRVTTQFVRADAGNTSGLSPTTVRTRMCFGFRMRLRNQSLAPSRLNSRHRSHRRKPRKPRTWRPITNFSSAGSSLRASGSTTLNAPWPPTRRRPNSIQPTPPPTRNSSSHRSI